jgi:hypothetical protein
MQDSVEDVALAVGSAFVSPSLGTAELIVGLLVAVAFAVSAVQTVAKGRSEEPTSWRERRK